MRISDWSSDVCSSDLGAQGQPDNLPHIRGRLWTEWPSNGREASCAKGISQKGGCCMKRVYFIRPIGQAGPVKIGCSVGPNKRRHELETWSPVPLEIVDEIDGGFDLGRRDRKSTRLNSVHNAP